MMNESTQLNVLISGGFTGAYAQLLPEFQRMSGMEVTTGSGASQGSGPQTIAAQLGSGVAADVVILSREGLSELIAAKMIVAGTDVDLARVRLGVAVRAGTTKPDVSTVEGFKQALLQAKTVAIPGSTGGIWLTHDLFPRLGITEKINIKVTPRGTDATGMVAGGDADLAVLPVSEILHAAGVDFAGRIASEMGASGPVAPLASGAAGLHAGRAVAYARAAMGRPRMFTYKATKGAPPGEITAVFSQHR